MKKSIESLVNKLNSIVRLLQWFLSSLLLRLDPSIFKVINALNHQPTSIQSIRSLLPSSLSLVYLPSLSLNHKISLRLPRLCSMATTLFHSSQLVTPRFLRLPRSTRTRMKHKSRGRGKNLVVGMRKNWSNGGTGRWRRGGNRGRKQ